MASEKPNIWFVWVQSSKGPVPEIWFGDENFETSTGKPRPYLSRDKITEEDVSRGFEYLTFIYPAPEWKRED